MYECFGLRVSGCVGVQVCGCAGVQVCECVGVRVCGCMSVWVYGGTSVRVYECVSVRVYGCVVMWVCGCTRVCGCGYVGVRVCGCTRVWVYERTSVTYDPVAQGDLVDDVIKGLQGVQTPLVDNMKRVALMFTRGCKSCKRFITIQIEQLRTNTSNHRWVKIGSAYTMFLVINTIY